MAARIDLFDGRALDLGRTNVMGVVNVCTESFWGMSVASSPEGALERADAMIEEGADIIDVGAESTRPGAPDADPEIEMRVIESLVTGLRRKHPRLPISVDTRHARVARAALERGADIINDVSGLLLDDERAEMLRAASEAGAVYVLTHTKGTPQTMASMTRYEDLIGEMTAFFEEKMREAEAAGVSRDRLIVDPGIGFAKTAEQCVEAAANTRRFKSLGVPVLIGASRKSFIGSVLADRDGTPLPADQRLPGTLAVSAVCALHGADIIRVHDVRANLMAVRMAEAIRRYCDE